MRRSVVMVLVMGSFALGSCRTPEGLSVGKAPSAHPRIATGAWKHVRTAAHPRLLGPVEHVRKLAKEKPELYAEIRQMRNPLALGIVQAVEGVPKDVQRRSIDRVLRRAADGPTNIHQTTWLRMQQAAEVFDFFHDAMTPAERATIIEWLNAHLGVYTDDESGFHNSVSAKIGTYLDVAWATWDENPRAREFRDYALKRLYEGEVVPVLRTFGAGGGATECGWYVRGSLLRLVEALERARRFEGYDGFAEVPAWFYQRLAYEIYQLYPVRFPNGADWFAPEGDANVAYSITTEKPRLSRMFLSQYFRGSRLSGYASNLRHNSDNRDSIIANFLYGEDPDPPLDMNGLPLAHLAAGIGKVYARSDWTEDATWFRFECGDWWTQHQHFESGNFEIFRRAPLAAESGCYVEWNGPHEINWCIRTIAHNCILIRRPDEKWHNLGRRNEKVPLANDGGQGANTFHVLTMKEWMVRRKEHFDRGDIVAWQNRPEFMYVAGDSTAAYAKSKAKRVLRQIVFIRPCTFVMLDHVDSTKAEYAKTWLLHCHNEPVIDGSTVRIVNGTGKLSVQTLFPEDAKIAKIEGYTYAGETWEPRRSRYFPDELQSRWRIEVTPGAPRTDDVFLHVFSTADDPAAAELVRKEGLVGARGDGWEVLFDERNGGSVTVNGKTWALEAAVKLGEYE